MLTQIYGKWNVIQLKIKTIINKSIKSKYIFNVFLKFKIIAISDTLRKKPKLKPFKYFKIKKLEKKKNISHLFY
jgi:hypothetical protein